MQADVDILSRHFDLDTVVHTRGKARLALGVLRRLLLNRPDVLLMWFIVPSYALALTILARMFGVKVAFVTGGYDIVDMGKIGFGAMRFPLFRAMLKPTIALSDLVIPFSRSAEKQLLRYARPRNSKVIYPGVDTDFFTCDNLEAKEPIALTVSPITETSITQKGLKTFVESAQFAPQMRFILVGRSLDGSLEKLRLGAPPNVEFIDRFLPAEELRDLYRRASCYIQASVHEGFGIAVAEAMACGTVPVVTKRFSLPEVTGGAHGYIPLDNPRAAAEAAVRSLSASTEQRRVLRDRITALYTPKRRDSDLVSALLKLTPRRRSIGSGDLSAAPIKLDLGCGSLVRPGFYGLDSRLTTATSIVADAQALPVANGVVDEVSATCLLEHFDAPYRVLDEVHRVLKRDGRAVFRLPNLGTYSSHLDTTHRFLADLALWRSLFNGYFGRVEVRPVGTKYRDSRSLVTLNWLVVYILKWHELAQGWDFVCTEPLEKPELNYVGWWEEGEHEGRIGGQSLAAGR